MEGDMTSTMQRTTRLQDLVRQLLQAAGIEPLQDVLRSMEQWLGIEDNMLYEGLTCEDCLPLDDAVYQRAMELCRFVWSKDPDDWMKNPFVESKLEPNQVTLEAVLPSVRVTRWMRHWMELNLTSSEVSTEREEDALIYRLFRKHDTAAHDGVKTLLGHIQELPTLQSQFHRYTHSLRQQTAAERTSLLCDPHSRLAQYQLAQQVATRLDEEWQSHLDRLQVILGHVYQTGDAPIRRLMRRLLARVWQDYLQQSNSAAAAVRHENTAATHIRLTLSILLRILKGTVIPLHESYRQLLLQHLVPLHQPDGMVLWRDQTAVLELYHEPLTQCIAVLLQKEPNLSGDLWPALIPLFPKMGNTPKQVLMLHELDTYVGLYPNDNDTLPAWWVSLLQLVARCMASDHSRVSERALNFFKNQTFQELVNQSYETSLPILLRTLVRSKQPWNPTVCKISYHVLQNLSQHDNERFDAICDQVFAGMSQPSEKSATALPHVVKKKNTIDEKSAPSRRSLKSDMGSWKPPMASTTKTRRVHPPQSRQPGRGVAPWAQPSATKGTAPPLTITGVAPWAVSSGSNSKQPSKPTQGQKRLKLPQVSEQQTLESTKPLSGADYVAAYMLKIKPSEESLGASSWSMAQLAETPTLLLHLKFHDLVFGHELGSGAFSVVKYARLIDRSTTRSHWPEYAVKIISTAKIQELAYEASVQREIAVLRVASHPGIARLISTFRFREGAYLVLEYASRGDLHSLLKKQGSLDEAGTRFVIGEVAAALSSLHNSGLVFGDLKPENIVITEPGHVKLTDFGGCRPVTEEAKRRIRSLARGALKNLRNGDWKAETLSTLDENGSKSEDLVDSKSDDTYDDSADDDIRIEGTTAYLPPEVVMGAVPTLAADSWALGCVMFQCLSGRPPLLEMDDDATRHRIVSFHVQKDEGPGDDGGVSHIFEGAHAAAICTEARSMISSLLRKIPPERPGMEEVASMDFLASSDIFSLHQKEAHALDAGTVSPAPDARWSRRQLSSIWSPQPEAYNVAVSDVSNNNNSQPFSNTTSAIAEGEEASGSFTPYALKSLNLPVIR